MRGTGYSLHTSLADLIDNCIAAKAGLVELTLEWNDGNPYVVIADDGEGMTEARLVEAMRFGGTGPMGRRSETDLGRFGLGLKTASLSQCRRLTVISKHDGKVSSFCWDLDHIRRKGAAWELLEGVPAGLEGLASARDDGSYGTLVIWDRIDFGRVREAPAHAAFLAQIERAEQHLAMVFHRYLDGDARRLRFTLNGRRIKAWDPFLQDHPSTIPRPEQPLDSGGVRIGVRGFILPHPDRFSNAEDLDRAGGPEGWTAQQGFYVYRQKRLLSAGGWLGLGGSRAWTREEFGRLARIRVDLPNSIDEDWRIDIRKAQARPPAALQSELTRIAADVRRIAREVFWHRGKRAAPPKPDGVARIWQVNSATAARRYTIRRDHPLVTALKEATAKQGALVDALIDLLERSVPVDRIWLDTVENGPPPAPTGDAGGYTELIDSARGIVRTLIAAGRDRDTAIATVARMDPFDTIPGIVDLLRTA